MPLLAAGLAALRFRASPSAPCVDVSMADPEAPGAPPRRLLRIHASPAVVPGLHQGLLDTARRLLQERSLPGVDWEALGRFRA